MSGLLRIHHQLHHSRCSMRFWLEWRSSVAFFQMWSVECCLSERIFISVLGEPMFIFINRPVNCNVSLKVNRVLNDLDLRLWIGISIGTDFIPEASVGEKTNTLSIMKISFGTELVEDIDDTSIEVNDPPYHCQLQACFTVTHYSVGRLSPPFLSRLVSSPQSSKKNSFHFFPHIDGRLAKCQSLTKCPSQMDSILIE